MGYFIRFTDNIEADIERVYSKNIHGDKLNGLCAWSISDDYNPYDDESIIMAAENQAYLIAKNTYAGYGSDTQYAVIEGSMTGGYTNDGVLINIVRVLAEKSL